IGSKVEATVQGPSIATADIQPTIAGDAKEAQFPTESLPYVDAAAVLDRAKRIHVSLVNRSHDRTQKIEVAVPAGYRGDSHWTLGQEDIDAADRGDDRNPITPVSCPLKARRGKVTTEIPPCGLHVLTFVPIR